MPRRRGVGFKRKSYGGAVRVNTKGYRVTSVSFGPKGLRQNVRLSSGGRRRSGSTRAAAPPSQITSTTREPDASSSKRRGCVPGCSLWTIALIAIVLIVVLVLI